jgi:hypothetical protein
MSHSKSSQLRAVLTLGAAALALCVGSGPGLAAGHVERAGGMAGVTMRGGGGEMRSMGIGVNGRFDSVRVERLSPAALATRSNSQPPSVVAPPPSVVAPPPSVVAPSPTVVAPSPTVVAPSPSVVAPSPTVVAPSPRVDAGPAMLSTQRRANADQANRVREQNRLNRAKEQRVILDPRFEATPSAGAPPAQSNADRANRVRELNRLNRAKEQRVILDPRFEATPGAGASPAQSNAKQSPEPPVPPPPPA